MEGWLGPIAIFQSLIERGSYLVFFLVLISAGLGAPVAEELVVLTAGALSRQGLTSWWLALAVCWIGVIGGDLLLFLAARRLGDSALEHPRFKRLLPPERRKKLETFYEERGGIAVFLGRHIPGVRAPLFALAGINHMDLKRFLFWDALSSCVNTPAIFFLGWFFSDQLERLQKRVAHVEHWAIVILVGAFALYAAVAYWRSSEGHPVREARRRWAAFRERRRQKTRREPADDPPDAADSSRDE